MFDPVSWTHDDSVSAVQRFRGLDFGTTVAAAFVASLSSRRLDSRSALASWSMIEHLTLHPYADAVSGHPLGAQGDVVATGHRCGVCRDLPIGWQLTSHESENDIDLNILNFERLKWGGVRHEDLTYVRFDLERFADAEVQVPTTGDWDQLAGVLRAQSPDRSEHLRSDWGRVGQWRGSDHYDLARIEQLFPEVLR